MSARHSSPLVALLALALAACASDEGDASSAARDTTPAPAAAAATAAPADTMVASGAAAELWLTDAREARDSLGETCLERALEIRHRDGRRVPVPLLYTAEAPRFVDDSTAEVHLWTDCRPARRYRVNLTTGQPHPVDGR